MVGQCLAVGRNLHSQAPPAKAGREWSRRGLALGYRPGNHIDASRYKVTSTVCQLIGDPARWSARVNDQTVVVGWAGYDLRTAYLPPEHYLAHAFREGLTDVCRRAVGESDRVLNSSVIQEWRRAIRPPPSARHSRRAGISLMRNFGGMVESKIVGDALEAHRLRDRLRLFRQRLSRPRRSRSASRLYLWSKARRLRPHQARTAAARRSNP